MRFTRMFTPVVVCVVFVFVVPTFGARAWGPRAMHGIAHTATRVVPPALGGALREYENEVLAGATIPEAELLKRFPHYTLENPTLTVASEIELLRTVKAHGLSGYLAYRMGVLGKLVAAMSQPFFTVPGSRFETGLKQRYEADAEILASDIPYESAKRQYIIDVRGYFEQRRDYLKDAEALIISDYDTGVGFKGYGKRSLNSLFSNAVNAVADVWYTVLGETTMPTTPATQAVSLRDYYVDAIGFYLQRDEDERAVTALASLESAGALDPDTLKKAADEYYENSRYDRAIPMYRTVLAKSPRRVDVRTRISDHFFSRGLALLEQKRYGEAERAFDEVLKTDVARAEAREKKLEVTKLIAERNKRLDFTRKQVQGARQATEFAARAEAQRKLAEAVALYRKARNMYAQVSDEFEEEFLAAVGASRQVEAKIERLKEQLVDEVRALQYGAVREQAREIIRNSNERAARTTATRLVQDEHAKKTRSLRASLIEEEKRAFQR